MPRTKATSAPPSKHHYVRVNGPSGLRVYVTNAALRDVPLTLLHERVSDAVLKSGGGAGTRSYKSRGTSFSVRVNYDRGEAHVQLTSER